MATPRTNLPAAQGEMKALLDTKLVEILQGKDAQKRVENIISITHGADVTADTFHLDLHERMRTETNFEPATLTVREFLSMLAHDMLDDPFVAEATRRQARAVNAERYEEYITEIDDIRNEEIHHVGQPLRKYIAFLEGSAALADEQKPLSATTCRDGITVMQALMRKKKGSAGFHR